MNEPHGQQLQPAPTDQPTPPASQRVVSIIIPAYNEAVRIGLTLERIREYVARSGLSAEIIVVDDGSDDMTSHVVRNVALDPLQVRLYTNPHNRGKGFSIRQGMLAADGDLLLMCDADMSTPIRELEKLLPWIDRGHDVVIGSRDMPDSRLDPPQPLRRRALAFAFRALRRRVLLPDLRDTQCGFKLFRREAAMDVFRRATVDGWLFDCEVLALAERLGYRIQEVGVVWRNDPDSRVQPWREIPRTLRTLVAIRRRLRDVCPDSSATA